MKTIRKQLKSVVYLCCFALATSITIYILDKHFTEKNGAKYLEAFHLKGNSPPGPISDDALIFMNNLIADDLATAMAGGRGKFGNIANIIKLEQTTSSKISKEYKDNNAVADEKYKGRKFLVTGEVSSVGKDNAGDIIIYLPSFNRFMPVQAKLDYSARRYGRMVHKWNSVALVCTIEGSVASMVLMDGCQPLQWVAEEKANKVVEQFRTWLAQGGNPPFDVAASKGLVLMYLAGNRLPSGHTCLEKVIDEKCTSDQVLDKLFNEHEVDLKASFDVWRPWLQISTL